MSRWTELIDLQFDWREIGTSKVGRVREDGNVYGMRSDNGQECAVRGGNQLLDRAVDRSCKDLRNFVSKYPADLAQ